MKYLMLAVILLFTVFTVKSQELNEAMVTFDREVVDPMGTYIESRITFPSHNLAVGDSLLLSFEYGGTIYKMFSVTCVDDHNISFKSSSVVSASLDDNKISIFLKLPPYFKGSDLTLKIKRYDSDNNVLLYTVSLK